jgi:hypothetical protein
MPQFDDREKNFEAKFAHDEEVRFRVFARRNKLIGLWAAGKLGFKGAAAEDYALEVVKAAATSADDEKVFNKVRADFDNKTVGLSEHQIRREMQDQLDLARQQIMGEEK